MVALKNKNGPQSGKVKKKIQKIFKERGLDIIIQRNIKCDNEFKYIHKNSNHPPSVIRQIPLSIELRLSTLYFNETFFQEAGTPYQKALQKFWL